MKTSLCLFAWAVLSAGKVLALDAAPAIVAGTRAEPVSDAMGLLVAAATLGCGALVVLVRLRQSDSAGSNPDSRPPGH